MSITYEEFLKQNIDLAPLGVERRETRSDYFCTPEGAEVIGWAGVDGIHYCMAPQFGELVLGVYPMNLPGGYVVPIAASFEDFLRLLLAGGDLMTLENFNQADDDAYRAFRTQNPPDAAQRAVMEQLRNRCGLTPLSEPIRYLKDLRRDFDSGTPACEPADESEAEEPCVWRVAFGENFWGKCSDAEAGKELPIGRRFRWADRDWLIPAVYLCDQGMVVDLCMSVKAEQERAFVEKCAALFSRELSDEESEQCEAQNPLEIMTNIDARVNGMTLKTVCGCSVNYSDRQPVFGCGDDRPIDFMPLKIAGARWRSD